MKTHINYIINTEDKFSTKLIDIILWNFKRDGGRLLYGSGDYPVAHILPEFPLLDYDVDLFKNIPFDKYIKIK